MSLALAPLFAISKAVSTIKRCGPHNVCESTTCTKSGLSQESFAIIAVWYVPLKPEAIAISITSSPSLESLLYKSIFSPRLGCEVLGILCSSIIVNNCVLVISSKSRYVCESTEIFKGTIDNPFFFADSIEYNVDESEII